MPPSLDFAGGPEAASVLVEALRLAHGYQFNLAFAIARDGAPQPAIHQRITPSMPLATRLKLALDRVDAGISTVCWRSLGSAPVEPIDSDDMPPHCSVRPLPAVARPLATIRAMVFSRATLPAGSFPVPEGS